MGQGNKEVQGPRKGSKGRSTATSTTGTANCPPLSYQGTYKVLGDEGARGAFAKMGLAVKLPIGWLSVCAAPIGSLPPNLLALSVL